MGKSSEVDGDESHARGGAASTGRSWIRLGRGWWIPLVPTFVGLGLGEALLAWWVPTGYREHTAVAVAVSFALAPLLALGWAVARAVRRRWWQAAVFLGGALLLGGMGFLALGNLAWMLLFYDDDHFADDLRMPTGIEVAEPLDESAGIDAHPHRDAPSAALETPPETLLLRHGMQGGIYRVEALVHVETSGTAYLRAYEVTTGQRLSAEILEQDTATHLGGSADAASLVPYRAEATIAEGNWGQFYAARFELWYRPDNGGAERKLLERVYRIEGWQR